MVELPDIEALSQEIAKVHLRGDLIPDDRVRRVTLAQLQNAPDMGPPHHRLLIGGRECKYIELVANVPDIVHCKTGIRFTLDDGFGRLDAWLPNKPALDNPKQKATITSLRPFDYAHIEGRVHRPPEHSGPIFQIISLRRVNSPYGTRRRFQKAHLFCWLSLPPRPVRENAPNRSLPMMSPSLP
ncbi:hypothetical protein FA13DRAFT_1253007 [Coprinellus micaceus]|uniref:Nucleic acid-binding protein n=1 Tax=Coprinellus micaceus TaxID=71717 RepID=A0A4Y7TQD5_COPMI|nr:hypothetical protein FA13DRAFT_1253007 [Coprinellus micaceus]